MSATQTGDVAFVPKVWSDHIQAYFDRSMGLGQLALMDKTLTGQPGETVTFPYFKSIGAAQKPAQDEGLEVDNLEDDSFSCTVYEIAKAVGWKDRAKRKSAANKGGIKDNSVQDAEAQRQIARVIAEQVDADLITEINDSGNYSTGYVGTTSSHTCKIAQLLESKVLAFGDKAKDAVAVAMHSHDWLSMMTASTAGFLKADANDPFWKTPGFIGRIVDCALFVFDTMPVVAGGINGKVAYYHFFFKPNPFGIYIAEDMNVEKDRDILHREDIVAATAWLGILSLHGVTSASDKRVARGAFATTVDV